MNKLLMAMLVMGLSACAMYEQERTTTGEVRDGEAGAVIVAPRSPRFDGKDYNDDFGEYDD